MQKLSGIRKKKPVEVQEAEVQGSKVPRPKVQS
jgi:hypothetical protein